MATVTKLPSVRVTAPGSTSGALVPFGTLSVSGGIINAYEAVKMAESRRSVVQP
jgi:hypothetical protein